jgi:DNA-binding SARP family transcriptional activator
MEFGLLGPLEVRGEVGPLELGQRKQRALLAMLLLQANRTVSRERLIDGLWGESPPETAVTSVQVYVSRLRKSLPDGVLLTRPPGYVVQVEPEEVDLLRFERLVADARGGAPARAAALLREALGLWRGPPLVEFAQEPFARVEAGRLEELRLAALEQRVEADLALGRHADLVAELEALIADHPHREQAHGQLMLALYRSGRQADALAAYRRARSALDELGLEPGAALRQLERQMLRQDHELDLPAQRPPNEADAGEQEPRPEAPSRRKTVTVVFCDLASAAPPGGSRDPEASQALMARAFERAAAIVATYGGSVKRLTGDALVAVFGMPVVHEDDAVRALRAALELREALPEFGVEPRLGVNSGEVVTDSGDALVTGEAVNLAARLQQAAGAGEILAGAETWALAGGAVEGEELEPLELTGKAERSPAFRLLEVGKLPERSHQSLFVGRSREIELLLEAWARVVGDGRCELVTVVGAPGVGKSRLAAELIAGLEAAVVAGRCLSYGEGIGYRPVVEVVEQLDARPADTFAASILDTLLGENETATTPDEIAWAFRKLLEQEAPLLVLFDDIQWGEETFLDLVEQAGLLCAGPVLLLCLARPELAERRPNWQVALRLEPLARNEVEQLFPASVPAGLRERIARAAGGNPLFVTEMAAMATSGGDQVTVPATLRALLAARLDQLEAAERGVLESGSVEGEVFHRGAVQALGASGTPVGPRLAALVRRELIRPGRPLLPGEDGFRFCHLLIRDAAYEALPKATRAELHERFAGWIEQYGGELVERDELVGYHLQQAYRYLEELGASESETGPLGEKAAGFLAAAGRRAAIRGDYRAVVNLLESALSLGVPDLSERLQLQVELGLALGQTGRRAEAEALLDATVEAAAEHGERGLAARARVRVSAFRLGGDPKVGAPETIPVAEQAIRTLEAVGDALGLAEAELLLDEALSRAGRRAESLAALERALAHAQLAGATAIRRRIVEMLADRICAGPMPVEEGIKRLEAIIGANGDDRVLEAVVRRQLAFTLAMAGRFSEAHAHVEASRPILDEVNLTHATWGYSRWQVSRTLELTGDVEAAEKDLIALWLYYRNSRGQASSAPAMHASATLALLCCDQNRWEEAAEYLSYGEEVDRSPPPYGKVYAFKRLSARARLAAHAGSHADAVGLAQAAVPLAAAFGNPNHEALAWLTLGEVERAAGNQAEADDAVERALELYDRKGNVAAATRVRATSGLASRRRPSPGAPGRPSSVR